MMKTPVRSTPGQRGTAGHRPLRTLPGALMTAALVVAGTTSPAEAVEALLYVDTNAPTCSNSGPGSSSVPFCTIDRAASIAVAGDTVVVAAGTYLEQVYVDNSGTSTAPIVFRPAAGAVVTVTGEYHGFKVLGRSWVTISGFRVVDTDDDGIDVEGSTRITIIGNEVLGSGAPNSIEKSVGIALKSTTDSVVSANVVHHNSDHGIYMNSSSGNTVSGNESYQNARGYVRAAAGIHLYRSSSNMVTNNLVHHNEDSGINVYTSSHNNLAVNNVSYDNGDHGVDVYQSTGNGVVANSVHRNVTSGLNAEGSSTGTTFANNVAVDNAVNGPRTRGNIRVDSSSDTGSAMNDDLMFLSAPGVMAIWDGVQYSSVGALRTATGQEPRGLQADPRWRDPGSGNFEIGAGSPAIDSANSGAFGQAAQDRDGTNRGDDPSTVDTGVGPRTYDDRGAFEFVPAPNAPPLAAPDTATVTEGEQVVVAVLANDADPDGDPLSLGGVSDPTHGTVLANPNGTVTYTAAVGWSGPDSFTYTVSDGRGGTDQATVSVTVTAGGPTNTPPLAVDDQGSTEEGAPVTLAVLANDSDPDGDPLQVTGVGPAAHGSATLNPSGTITYTPSTGYNGADQFTYTVGDGRGGADEGTVSVTVTPRNLVGNAGFETSTSGWNTSGSGAGVTLTRESGGRSGEWAARLTNTSTTSATCNLNDSPNWVSTTAAGTYTLSVWVRAESPGAGFRLRIREYVGTTLVGSATSTVTLTTSWTKVSTTYAPSSPGSSTIDLNGIASTTPPGICFLADDVSLTRG